jgi:purine-cytosine permease-like protein
LAVGIGAIATGLALVFDIVAYENFLFLIGSVFVPLFAVFIADYYLVSGRRWDVTLSAPDRLVLFLPWAAGFVAYQLVNPGTVGWWQRWWLDVRDVLGVTPPAWLSASLTAFVVAGGLTLLVATIRARRPGRSPVR